MSIPLIKTKLYIPPARADLIPRARLTERLGEGLRPGCRLILVSAPAGFGKTSLLAHWITQHQVPAGWVSLDEGDSEPTRFVTYLAAALREARPGFGETPMEMLRSPQPPPVEAVLTALINEIADSRGDLVVVLDDYHLVQSSAVRDALVFLLAHLPPHAHVVLSTRSDPFLPLSRLRARGHMVDIRADDLRFSPAEAALLLNERMGLGLTADQVAALDARTEGWVAGLQLAALSMRGHQQVGDAARFITAFAGDDRYVADYLVDEVLAQQTDEVRSFLLQTSILDQLSGPLCDAVRQDTVTSLAGSAPGSTGHREDGQSVLRWLDQGNLFIVPLDNQQRWYRYHRLFADLLRQRLGTSVSAEEIRSLHLRASQWYEENGSLTSAIEHSLAARDFPHAVGLIEQEGHALHMRSQQSLLLRWWERLPEEAAASRPTLCIVCSWAYIATGKPKEAEACLRAVELALHAEMDELGRDSDAMAGLLPNVRGALVEVAVARAELALERGDTARALTLTELAMPYLQDDQGPYLHNAPPESRLIVLFITGLAHKLEGALQPAAEALSAAAALGQERGNVHLVSGAYGHLANVQAIQGQLRQAEQTCRRGLDAVRGMGGEHSPMFGLLHVELGNLLYEHNDIASALDHLEQGVALAAQWHYCDALLPGYAGLARLRAAQGDWDAAYTALDEVGALCRDDPQLRMPDIEALRAMLLAAHGELGKAHQWAEACALDPSAEIDLQREAELAALVRVLIAQGAWDAALDLSGRLLHAVEASERWGRAVELLGLRALALDGQSRHDEALEALASALALAAPNGYVRTFIDEGEPMLALLRRAARSSGAESAAGGYAAELLASAREDAAPHPPVSPAALVEPLSDRELEVLRLLDSALSGPEIARELTIALSTLRTHTQHVYAKLGVGSRREAVVRAHELGMI